MDSQGGYDTVILKVSGEVLSGEGLSPFGSQAAVHLARQIQELHSLGMRLGVVIGGGNIVRGSRAPALGISRVKSDHMGMLATVINGIFLTELLHALHCPAVIVSPFPCGSFLPQAQVHEGHRLIVFVGGAGLPYLTTDTAAALRACEMGAQLLIKGTKVDGIFDRDPVQHPRTAIHLPELTYTQALSSKLEVMDASAIAICRDHQIPIRVINIFQPDALMLAVTSRQGGSLITGETHARS